MKDSQTDEENSFFLQSLWQRSKEVFLLERRIYLFLSKETNEEMEIKGHTYMYIYASSEN